MAESTGCRGRHVLLKRNQKPLHAACLRLLVEIRPPPGDVEHGRVEFIGEVIRHECSKVLAHCRI